jgi:hypothetical protein
VIDIAHGPKKQDALDMRAFMLQCARPSPTVCTPTSLPSHPNINTNAPTLSSPVGTSRCSNFYRSRGNIRRGSWTCWLSVATHALSSGQAAVTNYFHALGAGHITWLSRTHGYLWRYRNEGPPPHPPPR